MHTVINMLFSHLSRIDESGLDYEKLGGFETLVFCCIPDSKRKCESSTIKALEWLASADNKYYALVESEEIKIEITKILSSFVSDISISDGDYFLLLKSSSLVSGNDAGLKVIEIPMRTSEDNNDPDEIFFDAFNDLREEISKVNNKAKMISIGKNAIDKLLGMIC